MNKPFEPVIAANQLSTEARQSFGDNFVTVARMDARPEEKVSIYMAKTKLLQHHLGKLFGDEFQQSYDQAGVGIYFQIHGGICEAIRVSGYPNAAAIASEAEKMSEPNFEKNLLKLFTLFQPEKKLVQGKYTDGIINHPPRTDWDRTI